MVRGFSRVHIILEPTRCIIVLMPPVLCGRHFIVTFISKPGFGNELGIRQIIMVTMAAIVVAKLRGGVQSIGDHLLLPRLGSMALPDGRPPKSRAARRQLVGHWPSVSTFSQAD